MISIIANLSRQYQVHTYVHNAWLGEVKFYQVYTAENSPAKSTFP